MSSLTVINISTEIIHVRHVTIPNSVMTKAPFVVVFQCLRLDGIHFHNILNQAESHLVYLGNTYGGGGAE